MNGQFLIAGVVGLFEQFEHFVPSSEGVPSFRLCASLFLYIFQKVERRGVHHLLKES